MKTAEKTLFLLSIALVLYPKKTDEIASHLIQEHLNNKFDRLK